MDKRFLIIGVLVAAVLLVGCQTTGSRQDPTSAQNMQPAIQGFTTTDLDTGLDAIALSAGTGAAVTGNVPLAAAIERANSLLQCLQDTGSISGLLYTQSDPGILPETGASLIVNKTRVQENLFACLSSQIFAQTDLEIPVCAAQGQFTVSSDEFWFAYVGVGTNLCNAFRSHFSSSNPTFQTITIEGTYP